MGESRPPSGGNAGTYLTAGFVVIVAAIAVFVVFFRYQYVESGSRTDRVDRITGQTCVMPCLPPTPEPTGPSNALKAQRAIALVKQRDDAQRFSLVHADDADRYEWGALPSKAAAVGDAGGDESTFVVCYCKADSYGYRWEVHLASGEIFFMNDNSNLSQAYGLRPVTPKPDPTEVVQSSPPVRQVQPQMSDGEAQQSVVTAFYRAITDKRYREAYAMLSAKYRHGTDYENFASGYATTESVEATAHARSDGSNVVDVTLAAVDLKNAVLVNTTFEGYWTLVPDGGGGWVLDHGSFTRL